MTPVRSIALQATHDNIAHAIVLFYSNRRPEDAAFLDELSQAQQDNPNFSVVTTMTQMERSKSAWSGKTGYITGAMIQESVTDLGRPIYYISGPQAMAASMRKVLDELGVKDDKIRTEEFTGY